MVAPAMEGVADAVKQDPMRFLRWVWKELKAGNLDHKDTSGRLPNLETSPLKLIAKYRNGELTEQENRDLAKWSLWRRKVLAYERQNAENCLTLLQAQGLLHLGPDEGVDIPSQTRAQFLDLIEEKLKPWPIGMDLTNPRRAAEEASREPEMLPEWRAV